MGKYLPSMDTLVLRSYTTRRDSAWILLLYDCDTNKAADKKGELIKRVIPPIVDSTIGTGIENLVPAHLIARLESIHPQFIDVTVATA